MSKNNSPQSERLQIFIDFLGYSAARFARECGINTPRTLTKILSEGRTPSKKVLDKIISAFPMLNHDWIVLGYGEMIVKGLEMQPITTNALEKSTESTYQYIIQALRDHDFALNELSKTIAKAAIAANIVNDKVVENTAKMSIDAEKRTQAFFHRLDQENKKV